jgi:hypothetical protein
MEEAELQQREGDMSRMQSVTGDQRQGQRQKAKDFAGPQAVIAEDFQHIGQQGDARAKQDQPTVAMLLAQAGHCLKNSDITCFLLVRACG